MFTQLQKYREFLVRTEKKFQELHTKMLAEVEELEQELEDELYLSKNLVPGAKLLVTAQQLDTVRKDFPACTIIKTVRITFTRRSYHGFCNADWNRPFKWADCDMQEPLITFAEPTPDEKEWYDTIYDVLETQPLFLRESRYTYEKEFDVRGGAEKSTCFAYQRLHLRAYWIQV